MTNPSNTSGNRQATAIAEVARPTTAQQQLRQAIEEHAMLSALPAETVRATRIDALARRIEFLKRQQSASLRITETKPGDAKR